MQITSRWYKHYGDFEPVMEYLRETYRLVGGLQNWPPTRFENSSLEDKCNSRIWESSGKQGSRIVAVATPEARLRYFIQMHPDFNYLEEEVLKWIEEHCVENKAGEKLSIVVIEGNQVREAALRERGYERGTVYGIQRLRHLATPIPDYRVSEGFKIRSVEPGDFDEIAKAIRAVFGHGEWFTREILEEMSRASFYHGDLDLVAVHQSGVIASFCTFRYDTPSGVTELEPMGTLPQYRGRGIAKALLCEGFRRLKGYDVSLLCIDGAANNPAANRLYEETGFTTRHDYYYWQKTL
jgi:mycothiol synthase